MRRFIQSWNRLRSTGYATDYKKAKLFHVERCRSTYGPGLRGDLLFKKMVNQELTGIDGAAALDWARVYREFPNARTWAALGGFKALRYVGGLQVSTLDRNVMLRSALEKAADRGCPVTHHIVKGCAKTLGMAPPTTPTRAFSLTQARLRVLAQFIVDDYDSVPDEVLAAMPEDLATLMSPA